MRNVNYILIVVLFLFISVNSICAQITNIIAGKVIGDDKPLIGANVVLKEVNNSQHMLGASTCVNGSYQIQAPKGKYNLEITYIGYAKYTAHVEVNGNVTLPTITLYENGQLMDEVVVTARSITYNAEGYASEISKNPFYREQDMNSILKLSPGTNTTSNSISVYGQSVSKVYLNGRELQLSGEQLINYLGTLEGKNIKLMEVIAASGVEEDANAMGRAIIKIITINPETGGMLNVGDMSQMLGDGGKYSHTPSVMLNWRLGKKWSTYFNGNAIFLKSPQGNTTETHFYDTDVRLFNEKESFAHLKGMYRALWGISYDLDARNLFSFEGSYVNRNNEMISHDITWRMLNGKYEQDSEGTISNDNKYWENNLSFIYTHKFKNNGELSFQADRLEKHTDGTNRNRFLYVGSGQTANNNVSNEKHLIYTARLDYKQRITKGNGILKVGVKYSNILDEQDMNYASFVNNQEDNENSYFDLYKYMEEVYAAYAKYSFKVGAFDFNAGLRLEHALLFPRSSSNPERNKKSVHTNWAPELGVNYEINKEKGHNITLKYSRSISRPRFSDLNPRIERVNEYTYNMGNPLLGPRITDHYSLRTIFFDGYSLGISHTYSNDGIIRLPQNIDGILYTAPQRGLTNSDYSVYVGIPVKLSQWGKLDFSVIYSYANQSYQNNRINNDQWAFNLSGLFQLPKGFSLNIDLGGETPTKSLYGKSESNLVGMIHVNKSFLQRSLNVSLLFNDIFNSAGSLKQRYHYNSHSQILKQTYNGFAFGLNVRYTLRWGQKSVIRRGGSGNMEENSRLKSN